MKKLLFFTACLIATKALANPVHDWWLQCKESLSESTCLSETELAKFKTICGSKNLKNDCQLVVEYVIAKNRISEGRNILLSGYVSQLSYFTIKKNYLVDTKDIWHRDVLEQLQSFAVGVLPSCNTKTISKLYFGKNLRPELIANQKQFEKIYESLAALPCSESKDGFVLVTIGKVNTSSNDLEVFTLDEKKNFKVIQTGLGAGPFLVKK